MCNKSFGPKRLRLIKCGEPDWLDLLSRAFDVVTLRSVLGDQ
jgi:hypothetical protein